MFGRFVTGFKQALQVQSEPPTPSPGSPIPGGQRSMARDARYEQQAMCASSGVLERRNTPSPTPDLLLDGLSEAERAHILNVMARADSSVDIGSTTAATPAVKPPVVSEPTPEPLPMRQRSDSIPRTLQASRSGSHTNLTPLSTATSVADIPMDGLTEEERAHILRVMARAESGNDIIVAAGHHTVSKSDSLPVAPSPAPSSYTEEIVDPMLASQLENSGLEDWELRQIMSVMSKARRESDSVEAMTTADNEAPRHPEPAPAPDIPQQQTYAYHHGHQRRREQFDEDNAKLRHRAAMESDEYNEAPRRASTDSEVTEGRDEFSDSEGVHSSDETEGADEPSPVEDGSGYTSPARDTEPPPVSTKPESYRIRADSGGNYSIEDQVSESPLAGLDDPALLAMLPEGMESLNGQEQEQILAVLRRAAMESSDDSTPRRLPPTKLVADSEWTEHAAYPSANSNKADTSFAWQAGGQAEEDQFRNIMYEDDMDEKSGVASKRRVPDLKFEFHEEPATDQNMSEHAGLETQKGVLLGASSSVSITIQPPSPCPTEESESEEEDYWTKATQRLQQEQGDYDQLQDSVTDAETTADRADYGSTWSRDYEQPYYDEQLHKEEEPEEATEDYEWRENEEMTEFDKEHSKSEEEYQQDEAEDYQPEEQQQTARQPEEEIIDAPSPISDQQQPSPTEYAVEEAGGEEADNEEERYDRFDIDAAESSSYEDGNAAASAYYGTDYYMAEYQRSESGSSSGYGSKGVLGLSSYASGEGLSQQSGYGAEIGSAVGAALTAADSGLSRASSLQEQFSGDSGHAAEIADTRQLIEEQFYDVMTKSAPAETLVTQYEQYQAPEQPAALPKTEPIVEDYQEELWSGEPIRSEVQAQSYLEQEPFAFDQEFYDKKQQPSQQVAISESEHWHELDKRSDAKTVAVDFPDNRQQFRQDRQVNQWMTGETEDYYTTTTIAEPPPMTAALYKEPQYAQEATPEKRLGQISAPTPTTKTPERQSLFGSLRQAATSPTPKAAFGSFFSGASQALKSQTEAVLKKAVDTVSQVAAAADVQKPAAPMPSAPTVVPTAVELPVSVDVPEPRMGSILALDKKPELPVTTAPSMEALLGDYDYDSQYSLTKLIRHEPIIPTRQQDIIVQKAQQPVHSYDWTEQKAARIPEHHVTEIPYEQEASHANKEPLYETEHYNAPEPQARPSVAPIVTTTPFVSVAAPSSAQAPDVIEVPGMPDLDLIVSQFNEEERAHLLAMIGKAKEMEAELHSGPSSALPSRSGSFSHHGITPPASKVLEEREAREAMRLLEEYNAATTASSAYPTGASKLFQASADSNTLPWPVPSIREIGATPEVHVDVEQAFAAAASEPAMVSESSVPYTPLQHHQQQYDSSEVSSTMCEDEAEQQQRMTEIEADLNADTIAQDRYKDEAPALAECPLCNRTVLRCSQGSYGTTGQMCADCGVVVCTECGSVVPRYMGKVWLCGQCQLEEQAQIQKQYEQQHPRSTADYRTLAERDQQDLSTIQPTAASRSSSARRRRRRTTAVAHRQQMGERDDEEEEEELDDDDSHFRPSAALSQDEPKTIMRAMVKPSSRTTGDSDESDEDAVPRHSADDDDYDDYPDEVIEVPPAPVSPDAQGSGVSMDNGMPGDGLGADVLAAITSTFSSSSSDFYPFGDALVDSTPGRRSHLQQQQQIAFGTAATSLGQTAPPPVPARSHRAAPPPPAASSANQLVSEQQAAANVYASNITQTTVGYHSIGVTESSQFPQQAKTKAAAAGSLAMDGEYVDSSSSMPEMSREIVQQKHSLEDGSGAGDRLATTSGPFGHLVDRAQQKEVVARMAPVLREPQEHAQMDRDVGSTKSGLETGEDEQAATGESEEEEEEEEEQIDYAQAMKYYNNNPFFTHRPGPVYTIPEDEESDELSADIGDGATAARYRDTSRPNYQQLLKQHQQQQLLRQQQQQQNQPLTGSAVTQPPATAAGGVYQKRNPFIDEEEEYDNEPGFIDRQRQSKPSAVAVSTQQQRLPPATTRVSVVSDVLGGNIPAISPGLSSREVTSLVSSQQYFASQQQLQQKPEQQMPVTGSTAWPLLAQGSSTQIPLSTSAPPLVGATRAGFIPEQGAVGTAAISISVATQAAAAALTKTYAPSAASITSAEGDEYGGRTTRVGAGHFRQQQPQRLPYQRVDDDTQYAEERQGSTVAQRPQVNQQPLLQQKRQAPGAPSIDYTSISVAQTAPGSATAPGRPVLVFHDEDASAAGAPPHYNAQQPVRARENVPLIPELTPISSSDELFYQPGTSTVTVGQLVWKRDDQSDLQQQTPMTMSQTSTSSRSSEDEDAQDWDNQFVSKLKRSPAMILHADAAAAAAAAAAAGRRPLLPSGQAPPQQQAPVPQQAEHYEDVLTDEAPVAWPTFMGQKTVAPHQLPPFPPPPGSGQRQRYPSTSSEDQASIVAPSGLASAPSSTISGSGGGAVSAAGGRAPEMGRRKLPSIPQTSVAGGSTQSEPPYSVGGHYGTTSNVAEHQILQQPPMALPDAMSAGSHSWRPGTVSVASGPAPSSKDQRLRLVHATPSLRMPATLARVLLKQELREALTKRQQQLETCEIEANQRQYSVQRYLHTGIYPPSVGLQPTIPRTVLSTLPPDLLAGCRIIFHPPSIHRFSAAAGTYSASRTDTSSYVDRPWASGGTGTRTGAVGVSAIGAESLFRPGTANAATSTKPLPSAWPANCRDASIMTEPEFPRTVSPSSRLLARTSVATGTPSKNNASMTTQFHDAETQTWATTTSATFLSTDSNFRTNRETTISASTYGASRLGRASTGISAAPITYPGAASKTVSTSTEDLDRDRDHAQSLLKKQHRKLRVTSSTGMSGGYYTGNQRDQHHSRRLAAYFSDEEDDNLSREMRKSKIKDEIARRRQTFGPAAAGQSHTAAVTDFGIPTMGSGLLPPYYASDYSSHVPHYGSLPRMDFPSRHQFGGSMGDATLSRGMGTGSGALDPYGMQASGLVMPPPRRAVSLSGDGDYVSGWRGYYGGGQQTADAGRGLADADYFSDFGDYMSRDSSAGFYGGIRPLQSSSAGALRQISSSAPYLNMLTDVPSYRPVPAAVGGGVGIGPATGGDSGLLSHYASYLNREFANSSSALAAAPESYSQSWRRTAPDSTLPVGTNTLGQSAHNPTLWPPSNFVSDRPPYGYDSLSGATAAVPWRSSTPYASSYRSGYQSQMPFQPQNGLGVPNSCAAADPSLMYGYSTFPDRSWIRNAYRPAYQHQYMPPSTSATLPAARSLEALRSGFGLTGNAGTYGGTLPSRTPYWSPLEISAGQGAYGSDLIGGTCFTSGALGGGGFGNTIRYDSGYSSGGAGAGYASDSYHSNIGGLGDRQQSTLGRPIGYGNRPGWSSTDVRSSLNPLGGGYVSDSTLERRRYKPIDGNIPNDSIVYRTSTLDPYRRVPDGPRFKRVLLTKMGKDRLSNGSGLGMKIVGGKIIPGTEGELGAFVTSIHKGGLVDTLGEVKEGDQILEWNNIPLTGKTYEEVQRVIENSQGEIEIVLRSFNGTHNINLQSGSKHQRTNDIQRGYSDPDYALINGHARMVGDNSEGYHDGNQSSYIFKQSGYYSDSMMDGKASPCFSTTPRSRSPLPQSTSFVTGQLRVRLRFDPPSGTLFVHILSARELRPRSVTASSVRSGYPNPFVKVYLLPGRTPENKRRTKFVSNTCNPEWDQTVVYKDLRLEDLPGRYLEFTIWDYDRFVENQFLGRVLLSLADSSFLSGVARYFPLQSLNYE